MLNLKFSNKASKFLKNCPEDLYTEIENKLKELQENPFPKGFKKIGGRKEKVFRIRIGNHRILYTIIKENNDLLIVDIDQRSQVYKK